MIAVRLVALLFAGVACARGEADRSAGDAPPPAAEPAPAGQTYVNLTAVAG